MSKEVKEAAITPSKALLDPVVNLAMKKHILNNGDDAEYPHRSVTSFVRAACREKLQNEGYKGKLDE